MVETLFFNVSVKLILFFVIWYNFEWNGMFAEGKIYNVGWSEDFDDIS